MSSNRYYKTYGQLASESESKKPETTNSKVISAENPEMMRQILSKNMFVVVDIFGSWCGPCMKFKPVYDELASSPDFSYFKFVSIDIDNTSFNGSPFTENVTGVPTLRIYNHGNLVKELRGGNRDELMRELKVFVNK